MAFVAAKCTECGANIEVDDSKDAGICSYCNCAFVMQKAVNNYTTYVTKNIYVDGQNTGELLQSLDNSLESYRDRCQRLFDIGEFDDLVTTSKEMIQKWPDSYWGYLWYLKSFDEVRYLGTSSYQKSIKNRLYDVWHQTLNTSIPYEHPIKKYLNKFLARLDKQRLGEYEQFCQTVEIIIEDFKKEHVGHVQKIKNSRIIKFFVTLAIGVVSLVFGLSAKTESTMTLWVTVFVFDLIAFIYFGGTLSIASKYLKNLLDIQENDLRAVDKN